MNPGGPSGQGTVRSSLFWGVAVGFGLALLGGAFRILLGEELPYGVLAEPLIAMGALLIASAAVPARVVPPRVVLGVSASILTTLLAVAAGELLFRLVGYDFKQQEAAWEALPPCYRQPRTPMGTVFFRRHGPEQWTGQVIRTYLRRAGYPASAYSDEPVLTVRYDALGYRNPVPLESWEIAVAGDSFTELGFVPDASLFTTVMSDRLGCRVLNLGVSQTGPFTQLSYLEHYGRCPTLKHALVVFYEGNDLADLKEEYKALMRFEATGSRPFRPIEKQTSLLRALGDLLMASPPSPPRVRFEPMIFRTDRGDRRVTLSLPCPTPAELRPQSLARSALDRFYRAYRKFGRESQARIWIAYMPCKARVLHGRLHPVTSDPTDPREWSPSELPTLLARECRDQGIGFIDLTPCLVMETERTGELLFNAEFDIHLNARGSAVVGRELARRLASAPPESERPSGPGGRAYNTID